MRPPLRALPFVLVLLAGCASVQPYTSGSVEGRARINARAEDRVARVALRDGRRVEVRGLQVAADSLSWFDPATGALVQAPADDVEAVSFHTTRRALPTTLVGLAIGATTGYVAGLAGGESFFGSPHNTGRILGVGFGLLGASTGALLGVDRSNRDVYLVDPGTE